MLIPDVADLGSLWFMVFDDYRVVQMRKAGSPWNKCPRRIHLRAGRLLRRAVEKTFPECQ